MNILHPRKEVVSLAEGLKWQADGAIYQEKMDGVFAVREHEGSVLVGEQMPDGVFYAFDLVVYHGDDFTGWPLWHRLAARDILASLAGVATVPAAMHGGEFLRSVLARGGEGVVRKLPDSRYGDSMQAAKRLQTWFCRVTGFEGASTSVFIADAETGEPRGRVALRGGKVDRVQVGSVVKIEGFSLHASGFIREPRTCKDSPDSWLVKC